MQRLLRCVYSSERKAVRQQRLPAKAPACHRTSQVAKFGNAGGYIGPRPIRDYRRPPATPGHSACHHFIITVITVTCPPRYQSFVLSIWEIVIDYNPPWRRAAPRQPDLHLHNNRTLLENQILEIFCRHKTNAGDCRRNRYKEENSESILLNCIITVETCSRDAPNWNGLERVSADSSPNWDALLPWSFAASPFERD